jgi:S-DNA-T family DNA segregation ATPase FtsK/SpoIIIE
VGAALAAATLLAISLLALTDTRMSEVVAAVSWAGRHVGRALALAGGAVGKVVVAMFPEKDERENGRVSARDQREEMDELEEDEEDEQEETPAVVFPKRLAAVTAALDEDDSEAVRVGRAPDEVDESEEEMIELPEVRPARAPAPQDEERRAVAALVAEVAAVECAAEAEVEAKQAALEATLLAAVPEGPAIVPQVQSQAQEDEDDEETTEPSALAVAEPGPIIVEPPYKARLRREEEAAAAAAAEKEDPGDDGKGFIQLSDGAFALPATTMLEYQPPQGGETDKQALYEMADRLEQAMANYGVRGKVKEIHMGPVVTMFEFAPAPGTRTGKIAQLENDLAMALEAQAVRIVAPIPGKAVVGVEVPNQKRETVYLKEILEDDCFARSASEAAGGAWARTSRARR